MKAVVKTILLAQWGIGIVAVSWHSIKIWCCRLPGRVGGRGGWSVLREKWYRDIRLAITTFSRSCEGGLHHCHSHLQMISLQLGHTGTRGESSLVSSGLLAVSCTARQYRQKVCPQARVTGLWKMSLQRGQVKMAGSGLNSFCFSSSISGLYRRKGINYTTAI